jgi:hypothetical protein
MVDVVSGHLSHDPPDREVAVFRVRKRAIELGLRQSFSHRKIQATE